MAGRPFVDLSEKLTIYMCEDNFNVKLNKLR